MGDGTLDVLGCVACYIGAAGSSSTGFGVPAGGFLAVTGTSLLGFGVSKILLGLTSTDSERTAQLAQEMPSDFIALGAILTEEAIGDESGTARTIGAAVSVVATGGAGITSKMTPIQKLFSNILTGIQGAEVLGDVLNNDKNNSDSQTTPPTPIIVEPKNENIGSEPY